MFTYTNSTMNDIGFFAICQWYIPHDLFLTQKDTPCLVVRRNIGISSHILDADCYLFSSCSFSRIVPYLPHNAAHSAGGLQGFVIPEAEIRLLPSPPLLLVWPAGATRNEFTLVPIDGILGVGGQLSGLLSGISLHRVWNRPSCDMISGTIH